MTSSEAFMVAPFPFDCIARFAMYSKRIAGSRSIKFPFDVLEEGDAKFQRAAFGSALEFANCGSSFLDTVTD